MAGSGQYATPRSDARKPGGVFTLSAVGSWSPSSRLASTVKGVNAPAVLSALPPLAAGWNGEGRGRQGPPLGPLVIEITLVETWSSSTWSHGVNRVTTG